MVGFVDYSFPTLLSNIESRFASDRALKWLDQNWYISCIIVPIYLLLLYIGNSRMKDLKPYRLQYTLVMWNTGLAVFSAIGCWKVGTLNLAKTLVTDGIYEISCHTEAYIIPEQCLWVFLCALSKLLELGDTAFIVLRKAPLSVLHCYHHASILVYTFFCVPMRCAPVVVFTGVNLFIHSLMYSYYALRIMGYRVPMQIAQVITLLQILQMVLGLAINVTGLIALQRGNPCQITYTFIAVGLVMFTSYLVLFLNYFYKRYLKRSTKKAQ